MAVIAGVLLPVNVLNRRLRRRQRRGVRRRDRAGQHERRSQDRCHPPTAAMEDTVIHARQRRSAPRRVVEARRRLYGIRPRRATPAPPIGEAGVSRGESLQRDPDSEEVEAPLVEPRVPARVLVVAVVVDRSVVPTPSWWGKRPAPVRTGRLAGTPRRRSVAPRSSVEVPAVVVAVPRATGPAGAVITRSARSVHSGTTRPTMSTRSAGAMITRCAGAMITRSTRSRATWAVTTGSARSWAARSGATRPTWPVASSATARILVRRSANRGRGAVAAAGSGARSGAGRASAHAQRGCPEGAGDGRSGHQLLQFHRPSPVSWVAVDTCPRRTER
jgi:hypothetical protein